MTTRQPVSRRAALTALTAGAIALPMGAAAAHAAPAAPALLPAKGATGPLTPPSHPFTPDVPAGVKADVVLAAYTQNSDDPEDYGNYDLSNRRRGDIDMIVIHDTECDYETTLKIFTGPKNAASIHYVIREDGLITQMVRVQDVAWHAGNWTYNGGSIGIELIGVAEDPSHFTPAQYRATAKLVRHLSETYDVPLDRDHIVAHEDIPGVGPAAMPKMHWDPGAYYDWQRLCRLSGVDMPAKANLKKARTADVVTIAPTLSSNLLAFTSCNEGAAKLAARPSSAVMVRTQPADDAPLLADAGMAVGGKAGTDRVCDWGTQVSWGQSFAVADRRPGWTGLHIAGTIGWVKDVDRNGRPVLAPAAEDTRVITPKRGVTVRTYGGAFPQADAFTARGLTAPKNDPLPYVLKPGQRYTVEARHRGQYYWSKRYDSQGSQWVADDTRWLRIQINHRSVFVRAQDVVNA